MGAFENPQLNRHDEIAGHSFLASLSRASATAKFHLRLIFCEI